MREKFRIVCGTRMTQPDFFSNAALGRSLSLYRYSGVEVRLFANNREGLPRIYNTALREAQSDPAIMVFVHGRKRLSIYRTSCTLRRG